MELADRRELSDAVDSAVVEVSGFHVSRILRRLVTVYAKLARVFELVGIVNYARVRTLFIVYVEERGISRRIDGHHVAIDVELVIDGNEVMDLVELAHSPSFLLLRRRIRHDRGAALVATRQPKLFLEFFLSLFVSFGRFSHFHSTIFRLF